MAKLNIFRSCSVVADSAAALLWGVRTQSRLLLVVMELDEFWELSEWKGSERNRLSVQIFC